MQRRSKYFAVGAVWIAAVVLFAFVSSFLINAASAQVSTIYVAKVNGTPNLTAPGTEQFWSGVATVSAPLIPSSAYGPAGATSEVKVQMAWTDHTPQPELIVKLTFPNVGSGPSYGSSAAIPMVNLTAYPGSKLLPMYQNSSCLQPSPVGTCYGGQYPQDVGFLPLASGQNYVYPEQAMVVFGIQPEAGTNGWYAVSYKPKLTPGTSGALGLGTAGGGSAEIWMWSSNPTDNSSQDSNYPGLVFPNGTAVSTSDFGLPARASYAVDGYSNATSFYQLGGLPGSSQFPFINNPILYSANPILPTGTQLVNPYMVQSKGVYDSKTNSWTVEFVRQLSTKSIAGLGASKFQLQMDPNSQQNYYIAFAVNQGHASETYLFYYSSVSFWWAFNFNTVSGFAGYNNQYGRPTNGPAPP